MLLISITQCIFRLSQEGRVTDINCRRNRRGSALLLSTSNHPATCALTGSWVRHCGSEHRNGDAGRALQLAGDGMGALSGNQAHFLDGFAAFTEPLQLKGAGAAFGNTWGIAMDAEETDRAGEGWNGGGHGALSRGTPPVRHGSAAQARTPRRGAWLDPCRASRPVPRWGCPRVLRPCSALSDRS